MAIQILPRLQSVPTGNHASSTGVVNSTIVPPTPEARAAIAVSVVMFVITTAWTALRLYSKRAKGNPYFLEDFFCLVSLVCFYGLLVCNFITVYLGGSGHHVTTLHPFHIERGSKAVYGNEFFYAVGLSCTKISLVLTMKRVFFVCRFSIAAWLTIITCLLWMLFTILIGLFICTPVSMNWSSDTPGGRCGDEIAAFAAVAIIDIFTEVVIMALPIPMIYKLRMEWRYKVAVYAIFGAGALTILFGALRLYYVLSMDFADVTGTQLPVIITGTIQPGVAIVVSSSPLLKPAFDATLGKLLSCCGGRSSSSKPVALSGSAPAVALQTIGGSYMNARHSRRQDEERASRSCAPVPDGDGGFDFQLDKLRNHDYEVFVTACRSVGSRGTDDGVACHDHGSEDGIIVTNVTTVKTEDHHHYVD